MNGACVIDDLSPQDGFTWGYSLLTCILLFTILQRETNHFSIHSSLGSRGSVFSGSLDADFMAFLPQSQFIYHFLFSVSSTRCFIFWRSHFVGAWKFGIIDSPNEKLGSVSYSSWERAGGELSLLFPVDCSDAGIPQASDIVLLWSFQLCITLQQLSLLPRQTDFFLSAATRLQLGSTSPGALPQALFSRKYMLSTWTFDFSKYLKLFFPSNAC